MRKRIDRKECKKVPEWAAAWAREIERRRVKMSSRLRP